MTSIRQSDFLRWWLAPLLFAHLCFAGSTLCFGDDGHLAVEWNHDGRCSDVGTAQATEDHCGDCLDVQVAVDDPGVRSKSPLPDVAAPALTPSLSSAQVVVAEPADAPAKANPSLTSPIPLPDLRTTVLLI